MFLADLGMELADKDWLPTILRGTGARANMIAQAMGGRGETKMEERGGWDYTTINNELTGARPKSKR